jgi:putative glutamine amidotransferase
MGPIPLGLVDTHFDAIMVEYAEKVAVVDGTPIAIPRAAQPARIVGRLDGLILGGGEDVDPRLYGRELREDAAVDPHRDEFELALLEEALAVGVPILGICRGAMLLNVARGGSLVEHLDPVDGFSHAETDEPRHRSRHRVLIEPDSLLRSILGAEVEVNSFHHQAVDRPGRGVRIVGRSSDGVVEAVELDGHAVLGVHWHPEMFLDPDPLFDWLIQAAAKRGRTAA